MKDKKDVVAMGFQRDNILTPDERAASARKCLALLEGCTMDHMSGKTYDFLTKQRDASKNIRYAPTEPQLQWLRDLVSRHVT